MKKEENLSPFEKIMLGLELPYIPQMDALLRKGSHAMKVNWRTTDSTDENALPVGSSLEKAGLYLLTRSSPVRK